MFLTAKAFDSELLPMRYRARMEEISVAAGSYSSKGSQAPRYSLVNSISHSLFAPQNEEEEFTEGGEHVESLLRHVHSFSEKLIPRTELARP